MASFAGTGNGIELTDGTTGSSTFRVEAANFSSAGVDLGLVGQPSVSESSRARNVNPVSSDGVFSSLGDLRDALRGNDQAAITKAATALGKDLRPRCRASAASSARGCRNWKAAGTDHRREPVDAGAVEQVEGRGLTAAITKFSTLQTSLQATLQTTSQVTNLSLWISCRDPPGVARRLLMVCWKILRVH
jgi:hypothetical protein